MNVSGTIRKTLTAMLVLVILLWAEAGLALLPGDQVMQCPAMMMHGHEHAMTADDSPAIADDSDAMPCCPAEPSQAPKLAASHPPCCSRNDVPERPLGFLVNSGRTTSHHMHAVSEMAVSFAPPLAQHSKGLRSSDAPRFVKPVLDLKSDLRI